MDGYNLVLFFHLVGVVMLFAAIGIEVAMTVGVLRARTVEQVRGATYFEPILPRLFPASAVIILVFGMWLVGYYKHDDAKFGKPFVDLGLALLVVLAITGAAVQGRRMKAIHDAAQDGSGPLAGDLVTRISDPVLHFSTFISVALAVDLVFLMTRQPGWTGAWVSLIVAAASGAALGISAGRMIPADRV